MCPRWSPPLQGQHKRTGASETTLAIAACLNRHRVGVVVRKPVFRIYSAAKFARLMPEKTGKGFRACPWPRHEKRQPSARVPGLARFDGGGADRSRAERGIARVLVCRSFSARSTS